MRQQPKMKMRVAARSSVRASARASRTCIGLLGDATTWRTSSSACSSASMIPTHNRHGVRLCRKALLTADIDKPPYSVTETGWGEFEIQIKIFFVPESGEKPLTVLHHLKLHPWQKRAGGSAATEEKPAQAPDAAEPAVSPPPPPPVVHSWQYEEIVFPEPLEAFYETLIAHPPTPYVTLYICGLLRHIQIAGTLRRLIR